MWQTIHQKVRQAFSDAAMNYEMLSSLHKEIGRELVRKVMDQDCKRILDVGTGTGYLANKAKFYFPEAQVIGLDVADGMVLEANKLKEGIQIVQADACALPFAGNSFELILSNLAYQWVADFPQAFRETRRCLTGGGTFCATIFGYRTLEELFAVIQDVVPLKSPIKRLPNQETLDATLKAVGYTNVHVDYEIIKVQFIDVMDLLKWLKGIGANVLNSEVVLGKQMLSKMNDVYRSKYPYFEGISVTFEIIWIHAEN